jgi:hypothetical protein
LKPQAAVVAALALAATGCDGGTRPQRLLYGEHASEFRPVSDSVMTQARVLNRSLLGHRLVGCRAEVPPDARIVERIGVFGESLTIRSREAVFACDGGLDPAHERPPPWCGSVVGRLVDGQLLDPRLDILCEDRHRRRLAYAFVVPVAGAHWIGIDQGGYTEIYEVLAGLPVRVVTARRIDTGRATAVFEISQYDAHGRELVRGDLEARVAG